MDEVQSNGINLNSVANNFFNQFFHYIKENNRLKYFESTIGRFIWLENNNWCRFLKIRQPMTKVDTWIGNIDNFCNILVVLDYYLQMTLRDIIRTWSRWIIIFTDSISKFYFLKRELFHVWIQQNFFQELKIH